MTIFLSFYRITLLPLAEFSKMAALNLQLDETDLDARALNLNGRYSDWNAFCVVKRYLEPDGDLTMNQAAKLLHKMLPNEMERKKAKSTSSQADLFSCVFFEVAEQIPYHHPAQHRFVRLLKYLKVSDRLVMRDAHEVI